MVETHGHPTTEISLPQLEKVVELLTTTWEQSVPVTKHIPRQTEATQRTPVMVEHPAGHIPFPEKTRVVRAAFAGDETASKPQRLAIQQQETTTISNTVETRAEVPPLEAVVVIAISADLLIDENRKTILAQWAANNIDILNQAQSQLAESTSTIPLKLSLALQIDTLSGTITEVVALPNSTATDQATESTTERIKAAMATAALKTIAIAPITTPTVEPHLDVVNNPYPYLSKQLMREVMLTPERSQTDVDYLPPLVVFVLDEKRRATRMQGLAGKEVKP